MTITAKFSSTCPICRKRIVVGSKVEWARGQSAVHIACTAVGAGEAGAVPGQIAMSALCSTRGGGLTAAQYRDPDFL